MSGCDEHNVGYVKITFYNKSFGLQIRFFNTVLVEVEDAILTPDKTGCWASSGHTAQGCAALEQALRDCMAVNVRNIAPLQFDKKSQNQRANKTPSQRPKDGNKNRINSHLSRLYPLIKGPHKKN